MKKRTFLISLASVAALCIAAFIWTGSSNGNNEAAQTRNFGSSLTVSPEVPFTLSFADEDIEFDRYDLRERLDRELTSFTYLHSSTLSYFKRANRIFPIVVPILKQNGIPEDFKYMMVIESNLNERALSTAKAAGLWQFMESTGRTYGLEIGNDVDERYHIEK